MLKQLTREQHQELAEQEKDWKREQWVKKQLKKIAAVRRSEYKEQRNRLAARGRQ